MEAKNLLYGRTLTTTICVCVCGSGHGSSAINLLISPVCTAIHVWADDFTELFKS